MAIDTQAIKNTLIVQTFWSDWIVICPVRTTVIVFCRNGIIAWLQRMRYQHLPKTFPIFSKLTNSKRRATRDVGFLSCVAWGRDEGNSVMTRPKPSKLQKPHSFKTCLCGAGVWRVRGPNQPNRMSLRLKIWRLADCVFFSKNMYTNELVR